MVTLYLPEPGMRHRDATSDWGGRVGGLTLLVVAVLILFLGVYPTPMIHWVTGL
jgi:NADH-quinone oxidoreductase subunit N